MCSVTSDWHHNGILMAMKAHPRSWHRHSVSAGRVARLTGMGMEAPRKAVPFTHIKVFLSILLGRLHDVIAYNLNNTTAGVIAE